MRSQEIRSYRNDNRTLRKEEQICASGDCRDILVKDYKQVFKNLAFDFHGYFNRRELYIDTFIMGFDGEVRNTSY